MDLNRPCALEMCFNALPTVRTNRRRRPRGAELGRAFQLIDDGGLLASRKVAGRIPLCPTQLEIFAKLRRHGRACRIRHVQRELRLCPVETVVLEGHIVGRMIEQINESSVAGRDA